MLLDLLKANLTEETFNNVSKQLEGKDLKVIPKARFDEVNNSKKQLESKLSEYADYNELKTANMKYQEDLKGFADYDTLKQENVTLKNEGYKAKLLGLNVDKDFVDIALANIDTSDPTKFEANAQAFLKDNPKFTAKYVDKNGVIIGMQNPNNQHQPVAGDEVAQYKAQNKKIYGEG